MARTHARIQTGIWTNPDFLACSADAQRLYMLLLSQPELTFAGVLPYLPRRWARLATESDVESVEKAVIELEHQRFVIVDHDTDELVIRTFVKHDMAEALNNKKMRGALKSAIAQVHSYAVVVAVVDQVPEAWRKEIADTLDDPINDPIDNPIGVPRPAGKAIGSAAEVGAGVGTSLDLGGSSIGEGRTSAPSTNGDRTRGTRIPEVFSISDDMEGWAQANCPLVDLEVETTKFVNYWKAKSGRDAAKRDWNRTWQNWMLTAQQDQERRERPRTASTRSSPPSRR